MVRRAGPGVVAKLNADINSVLQLAEIRAHLGKLGMRIESGPPERFDARIKAELARWTRVVAAAKIKPD